MQYTTVPVFFVVLLLVVGMGFGRGLKNKRGHKNMFISSTQKVPSSDKDLDSYDGSYMSSQDICDSWWCGDGQECRPGGDSLPTCVCKEDCSSISTPSTNKKQPPEWEWDLNEKEHPDDEGPVCGNDGLLYPSECELHRSGCLAANPHLQVIGGPELCGTSDGEGQPSGESDHDFQPQPDYGKDEGKLKPGAEDAPSQPRGDGDRPGAQDSEKDNSSSEEEKTNEYYPTKEFEHDGSSSLKKMRKSIKNMRQKPEAASASETQKNIKRKRGSTLCTISEYKIFKEALLKYNKKHLVSYYELKGENNEQLISRLFGHFDRNHDGVLDYTELQMIGFEESLGRPMLHCHPVDFLHFDDANHDAKIDPSEFETAFITTINSFFFSTGGESKRRKVIRVKGKVAEKLELRCPISSTSSSSPSSTSVVEWRRYGRPMDEIESTKVLIQEDGVLLSILSLELVHAGNFSCGVVGVGLGSRMEEQSYVVTVTSEPKVQVHPHMMMERPGAMVKLECRVQGEPKPSLRWLKNEAPLSPLLLQGNKYRVAGPFLEVDNVGVADTGAYMCEGSNNAGSRVDIASLLVLDEYIALPSVIKSGTPNESLFVLLYEGGISLYNPTNCRLHQEILGSDIIPGTQKDLVCGSSPCIWGSGILVGLSYIYASQPSLNRLLVVSLSEMVVVDVIPAIGSPTNLKYVPHIDQVWVHGKDGGIVLVVRDAKQKKKHRAKSVDVDSASPVRSIFVPSDAPFSAGYLTKEEVRGMYKVDLTSGRYLKSVDLSGFNCLPEEVQFSRLYGFLILECREPVLGRSSGTLLLDSMTDAVVEHYPQLHGRTYLSPDGRWLVTLSARRSKMTDFVVHQITQNGLLKRYTVRSFINVSEAAFFPSQTTQSYDLFATGNGHDEHLLYIDLSTGKTESVPGVGKSLGHQRRSMAAQVGDFGHFLVTPGSGSAFVVNGRTKTVNCQVGGRPLHNISSILWLHGQTKLPT